MCESGKNIETESLIRAATQQLERLAEQLRRTENENVRLRRRVNELVEEKNA